ncbi:hypothetical protein [Enterococcus hirae]|uniref:hypothetical protein n=1 Tax=Enterococcus hirae TaxID=1354 RepID=UPI00136ACFD0|nr:hypothetical protein [Enterococcus hirae]NAE18320.1 hypothetical protein [Enterococcus hirae]
MLTAPPTIHWPSPHELLSGELWDTPAGDAVYDYIRLWLALTLPFACALLVSEIRAHRAGKTRVVMTRAELAVAGVGLYLATAITTTIAAVVHWHRLGLAVSVAFWLFAGVNGVLSVMAYVKALAELRGEDRAGATGIPVAPQAD